MIEPTFWRGLSEPYGSWKMTWMRRGQAAVPGTCGPSRPRRRDVELMAAETGGELTRRAGRRQRRLGLGAFFDRKAAARPERTAAVEPSQIGRLPFDRIEARLTRPV